MISIHFDFSFLGYPKGLSWDQDFYLLYTLCF
ncbi:hypothetical protein Taro_030003 [Colocasia esculenta]|uniref:Uncharacterized protein n=1 Tax=Colocasia esculenta TaxID=4460 RepID=A0A843VUV2_COLES|nr:hypothetical protein [Colocasia esculenta]